LSSNQYLYFMKAMNLRIELKQLIDSEQNLALLKSVKSLLSQDSIDWWHTISKDERLEIEKGIEQADSGDLIPHKEVMKNPKKWL